MNGNAAVSHGKFDSLPEVAEALSLVHSLIGEDLLAVDGILDEDLDSEFRLVPEVARHLIGAGGKRVRPILTCLVARALGARGVKFRELAAIVEMVHTATLFHDDVIDEARIRRGRPAAHVEYGVPVAILVGDRLYSDAFRRLLDLRPRGLARDLSRAVKQVLEGEFFQLQRRGREDLSFNQYLRLIGGKTAALFRFATRGAARNARADREVVRAASRFGWNLGIAFQMTDDVIDVESDTVATGKTRFQDLDDRKISLPLLVAMRRDEALRELVAEFMAGRDEDTDRPGLKSEIRSRIQETGATAAARGLARRYAVRAAEELAVFPDNLHSRALRQITFYVCNRNA